MSVLELPPDYTEIDTNEPVLDNSPFEVIDLSCKSENRPVEPEVLVDVWQGEDTFVRIPVTQVELWINKDGPADLNRTAKVTFPGEWDGFDIQSAVNGFSGEEGQSYDMARVWFYDERNENYQISHFGYIGGVGPASESGVFKFWVYDPADLLKGVPVSKSFTDPTIADVLNFAVRGEDEVGEPVGLENRTVFEQVAPIETHIAGLQDTPRQKVDTSVLGQEAEIDREGEISVGPYSITSLIDDIFEYFLGADVASALVGGQKSFQRNRSNMVDVLNWYADKIGGKWHFEPTPSGPVLWYDNLTDNEGNEQLFRRNFVEQELTEEDGPQLNENLAEDGDIEVFDTVRTLDNMALRDMKPFNTLRLYGESSRATRYTTTLGGFNDAASASALGEAFPYVEVTYGPLFDRANGHKMLTEIESDEVRLEAAEQEAVKQFRQQVEEETEGSMKLMGEPYILPYDYIINVPVCEETFQNIDAVQMRYEVNSVKHTRSAGERYKTDLGVSIALRPNKLDVTSEYKAA
jgi:hypothetical protein